MRGSGKIFAVSCGPTAVASSVVSGSAIVALASRRLSERPLIALQIDFVLCCCDAQVVGTKGHQETRRPRYPRGRFTSVTGRRCSGNGDLPSMKSAKSCRVRSRGSLHGQSLSLRRLNRARTSVRHWSSLERVAEADEGRLNR